MQALEQKANTVLAVDGGKHLNTHPSPMLSGYKLSEGQEKWEGGK